MQDLVLIVKLNKDLFDGAVIGFYNNVHKLAYKAYQASINNPN